MRVLFLDIDGVLNTDDYIRKCKTADAVMPEAVALVNRIVDETGAVLVIASNWRFLDDTDSILDAAGLRPRHPDKLSRAIEERQAAALAWLAGRDVAAWVAIDDRKQSWDGSWDHLVSTYSTIGLREREAERAIKLLGALVDAR